jgi:hypothetical protein
MSIALMVLLTAAAQTQTDITLKQNPKITPKQTTGNPAKLVGNRRWREDDVVHNTSILFATSCLTLVKEKENEQVRKKFPVFNPGSDMPGCSICFCKHKLQQWPSSHHRYGRSHCGIRCRSHRHLES